LIDEKIGYFIGRYDSIILLIGILKLFEQHQFFFITHATESKYT